MTMGDLLNPITELTLTVILLTILRYSKIRFMPMLGIDSHFHPLLD